jgi:hypothetical protein
MAERVISSNRVICNGDFDYYKPEINYDSVDSFNFKVQRIKEHIKKILHIPTIAQNLSLKKILKDNKYCLDLKFILSCDAGRFEIARIIMDEAEKNNYIIELDAFYEAFECCLLTDDIVEADGIEFAKEIYRRSNRQIDIFRNNGELIKKCLEREKINSVIFLCHLEPNHYYLTVEKTEIMNNIEDLESNMVKEVIIYRLKKYEQNIIPNSQNNSNLQNISSSSS